MQAKRIAGKSPRPEAVASCQRAINEAFRGTMVTADGKLIRSAKDKFAGNSTIWP